MLHAVAHRNVGSEVKNEGVVIEIRGGHQGHFRVHNLLEGPRAASTDPVSSSS